MSFWGTRPSPFTSPEVTFLQALADHSFTDGQLIIGNTSTGGVSFATLTAGSGMTITNAGGTITLAASGGAASLTVGTSTITSGTTTRILYDNAGVLGEYTISGSGTVVAMATSPSFTTPSLGVATATSLAIGGATIGTNGLAITGHILLEGVTSTGATGTGKFVFDTAPTLSNPVVGTQTQLDGSTKAASTAYVDTAVSNAVAGVNPAVAVQVATTAASDTSSLTYVHVAGIGDTFTGSLNTAITIDGHALVLGDRVLVKNDTQTTGGVSAGVFNGVYLVTVIQSVGVAPVLTRALDYDTPSDINNTGAIPVVLGTANASTTWVLTSSISAVGTGTNVLTYAQFSIAPSSIVTLTGSQALTNKTYNGNTWTAGTGTLTIAAGKTLTVNNTLTLAGTDSTTMTFPAASDTVAGLGTTQTFTGIQTFSPTARSSGSAAFLVINTPTDTAQTAATESIGIKTVTATRTWATTGTVALQREIYLAGPTYASASASQTFTDATTLYIDKPVQGTNAVFTRAHSLTIVDSTSAASSVTGGLVIATTLGTSATSVGIGGGNINAGGTLIVGGHVTLEGVTSTGATGTGKLVFDTSPTFTTSILAAANTANIGSTSTGWAHLYITSGGVLDFNNGDVTITHASNLLTFAGGQWTFGANTASFTETDNGNSGTTKTIDWTLGNKQKITTTGSCTLTFTAPNGPCSLTLRIVHEASASAYTYTYPAAVKWPGGTKLTTTNTSGAVDIVTFYYDGTNYSAVGTANFS